MAVVDVYFGLGSRYSYLAFSRLPEIERRTGAAFVLHPISSIELMAIRGSSPFARSATSGQYDWSYRRLDAERWARYYGVAYAEPKKLPDDHRLMARACVAARAQGALRPYCERLFRAVFADQMWIDSRVCIDLAKELAVDAQIFERDLAASETSDEVTRSARSAARRGAFGVPTFFVGEQMFWGNDRLVLIEHALMTDAAE